MKRKLILFFILIFFLSVAFTREARGDYASSYQDYINQTGSYQSAYNDYLTARGNYLASHSIDSQDKAKAATLKMLQARDSLISSYLNAIKLKIQSTQGISSTDASSLGSRLDTEISWYQAHNTKLASAGSLDDLVSDSDDAKTQYNSSTLLTIYSSIIALGVGNNTYIRGELNNEETMLQAKIDEIKANQDKDVSSVERSLIDVKNKLDRSQSKDSDAENEINAMKPNDQQGSSEFQTAQSSLTDSNAYLKEANEEMLQIITQIKTN